MADLRSAIGSQEDEGLLQGSGNNSGDKLIGDDGTNVDPTGSEGDH